MRVNPLARALKNSVLKGAVGSRPADVLARGVEAAGVVGASTSEFLRVRRDPSEVALRRRRAAVRRVNIWGAGVAVGTAGGAALAVSMVGSGVTASTVFTSVLVLALIIWCAFGLVRAVIELRSRSRALAALPPPQPPRRPVASPIKADMGRLDAYSDGLRQLLTMLPLGSGSGSAGLQREVLTAADAAERRLRQEAQEFTGVRKTAAGAPSGARPALENTQAALGDRIRSGVDEYGRLVAAATETVAASAQLTVASTDLQAPTDRLRALAMGMREIAEHARPAGPSIPS